MDSGNSMPEQQAAHNSYQAKAKPSRGGFGGGIGRNAVDTVGMLQKFMGNSKPVEIW